MDVSIIVENGPKGLVSFQYLIDQDAEGIVRFPVPELGPLDLLTRFQVPGAELIGKIVIRIIHGFRVIDPVAIGIKERCEVISLSLGTVSVGRPVKNILGDAVIGELLLVVPPGEEFLYLFPCHGKNTVVFRAGFCIN